MLGSTGRIGGVLHKNLRKDFQILKPDKIVDYGNLNELSEIIISMRPNLVINCAGYTGTPNVDSCLDNKTQCLNSNCMIPRNINICSKRYDFRWIHVSSGCIYNGYDRIYDETDDPNFVCGFGDDSFYSTTKAFGESVIDTNCHILRIRMPFTTELMNGDYIHKILNYERLISKMNSVTFLDDFVNNVKLFISDSIPFGIYNMVNTIPICSEEIVDMYSKIVKKINPKFVGDDEFDTIVRSKRSNCVLSNKKSTDAGCVWSDTYESVRKCIVLKYS